MAYPQFDSDGPKILFFTRGRGRGHAIPDMEIARRIQELSVDTQIRFVSYGTGSETLEAHGVRHICLDLPDRNPLNETTILAGKLIGYLSPDLVVAHEEFAALIAAKIFDVRTVLLTDWFTDPDRYTMTTLPFADDILFLDEPGHYPEPACVTGRVEYIGPVIRDFCYTLPDRSRARRELGIAEDSFVLAVMPGSCSEEELPIVDLAVASFDAIAHRPKHLIWIAGADYEVIRGKLSLRSDVTVLRYDPLIDRVMVASDIVLSKGTRKTLFELSALGVPSISISGGGNAIDDARSRRFDLNVAISRETRPEDLAARLVDTSGPRRAGRAYVDAASECARRILAIASDVSSQCANPCDL